MPNEIELKLAFPPEAHREVLNHPLLAAAARVGHTQTLVNTYFDTPDQALSAQKVALRTRKAGRRSLQTVKCAAASQGGLSTRPEWEQPYRGSFDFNAIDMPEVRALLEAQADRIVPLFTTNFHRTTFALTPRAGVVIHAMVDTGLISANGRTEPIAEVELEIIEGGEPDDLFAIACELAATLPLLPYDPSKAERGYRLFRNEPVRPRRTGSIHTEPLPPLAVFRSRAQRAMAVWAANQHAAPASTDPEYVHQLRLTLRRLRNLIRLFGAVLPPDFVDDWPETLGLLAGQLAEARDLGVLHDEVLTRAAQTDPSQPLAPLLARARHEADAAGALIRARLAAPGCGIPLLVFARAVHALPEPSQQPTLDALSAKALRKVLRLTRQRLAAAQAACTPETMHALRIAIKRLRHALDVFAPYFPPRTLARLQTRVGDLQGELGRLHDLAVALPRLRAWAADGQDLREGVAFVTGWLIATSLQLERDILPRCADLLDSDVWRLRKKPA